ncbi:MAG: 4-alpha-glucanotransferase, partial [Candidatus Acidiferrales bacterium]
MKSGRSERARLHELARLCGVETSSLNCLTGRPQRVGDGTLVAVLRGLGVELRSVSDAGRALSRQQAERWQRGLEPVVVAWDGRPTSTLLRLPAHVGDGRLDAELRLETGETIRWIAPLGDLRAEEREQVGRERFVARRLALPPLPLGYHRLRVGVARREFEALILAAPQEAFAPAGRERAWGLFLPLYSLRTKRNMGAGDFTDLEAFSRWMARQGGQLVGTLPLLAAFLSQPFEPSPYSPASRLFWNEFYVNVMQAPELGRCTKAKQILDSPDFRRELEALRTAPLVDYRRGMALKRRVLEPLARSFFFGHARPEAFLRFLKAHADVEDYARFRAVAERRRAPWPEWPARLRGGNLKPDDFDEAARRYHLYAQWLAHSQLERFSARAGRRREGLYLDMPLGVHPLGFDVWRHQDVFALEADGGAPPDPVWTTGQNWSFAPLHPERLREQGYGYFIASLRHQLRHAAWLRVDHIMGFHRLFWIPKRADAGEG